MPDTPQTPLQDEEQLMRQRLAHARQDINSSRQMGNMRSMRQACEELSRAEQDHTRHLVEERTRLCAELEEVRCELAAAQSSRNSESRAAHEELTAMRTKLTLANNQLAGARLQYETEARVRAEPEKKGVRGLPDSPRVL